MTDTPAVPPAPVAPGPKQTLSIVALIGGIASFVLSWVFVLGFLISVAAIVISVMARGREPGAPKWMWIIGLVGGILGLVGSIIWGIITVVGIIAGTSLGSVNQF